MHFIKSLDCKDSVFLVLLRVDNVLRMAVATTIFDNTIVLSTLSQDDVRILFYSLNLLRL